MKTAGLIGVIAVCALVACQEKEAVFTLVESKRVENYPNSRYKDYLSINILVENVPKDRVALQQLMMYSFLHMTSSVDMLRTHLDLESAICIFMKSTSKTRGYFTERKGYVYGDVYLDQIISGKTYIGVMTVDRCNDDPMKLTVEMRVSLERNYNYEERPPNAERHILLNECEPNWYESNKDNDLVKYYMELRNK